MSNLPEIWDKEKIRGATLSERTWAPELPERKAKQGPKYDRTCRIEAKLRIKRDQVKRR